MNLRKSRHVTAILFSSVIFLGASHVAGAAGESSVPAGKAAGGSSNKIAADLIRLRSYKDSDKVIADPAVQRLLKAVMGTSLNQLYNQTESYEEPELTGNELVLHGGVAGLYGQMESLVSINLSTREVCVALLNAEDMTIFGNAHDRDKLPAGIKAFIKNIETQGERKITFSKPTTKPIALETGVMKTDKNLNVSSPTGTFQRQGTERWSDSTLEVQSLPGGKIKFDLQSAHGARTGGADGTVPIKNGIAKFSTSGGSTITLKIHGAQAEVSIDDKGDYGGMGVTPTGHYLKKSSAVPKFSGDN